MASEEDPLAAMSAKLSGGVGTKIKGLLGRLRNKFALPSYGQQSPHTTSMNEIIASKDMAVGKALVMQHGCDVQPRQVALPHYTPHIIHSALCHDVPQDGFNLPTKHLQAGCERRCKLSHTGN